MNPQLERMLADYKRQVFYGRLYKNRRPTDVDIQYGRSEMVVRGLHDLFPFLKFTFGDRGVEIRVSKDGIEYQSLQEKMVELAIFTLHDPFIVLPEAHFTYWPEGDGPFIAEGRYKIDSLFLPDSVKAFFKEHAETERWIRLLRSNGRMIAMEQKDFPPLHDIVQIRFRTRP